MLDPETLDVLNARITPSTRERYEGMLIRIIRFFQDNARISGRKSWLV